MELTISPAAQTYIEAKRKLGDHLLLDNEDGHGPFVDHAVSCQLDSGFRLLFVSAAVDPSLLRDYSVTVTTEIGSISMKPSAKLLLDPVNQLVLEPTYQRLQLKSVGGILSANVPLIRKESEDIE
jgi:uncharacterized protein YqkB